ncbi:MAG: hypothetical protein JKY20_08760 [Alphaproteobacteria bacterium]|nr:hypothetical protein [Alphaproteobacteria bacterium]
MSESKTHRSFVSYIDKSREYYGAHGYERPYAWAHHDEAPFQALTKPLSQCRVGVVTTADLSPRGAPRETKLYATENANYKGLHTDKSWDKDATHTDDPETYLPLERLGEWVEKGRIESLSERFYGAPTDFSKRLTTEQDAPQIERWMRDDGVDVAILIPL